MDAEEFLNAAGLKIKQNIEFYLEKIKDALAEETEHNKEMLETYQRFVQGQASKEEMEKANEQFKSFLKTIGFGVLVVLPFSPITIPVIVKLGKKYGIDVLPNSFRSRKH